MSSTYKLFTVLALAIPWIIACAGGSGGEGYIPSHERYITITCWENEQIIYNGTAPYYMFDPHDNWNWTDTTGVKHAVTDGTVCHASWRTHEPSHDQ